MHCYAVIQLPAFLSKLSYVIPVVPDHTSSDPKACRLSQCGTCDAIQLKQWLKQWLKQAGCALAGTVHWTPKTTLLYPAIVTLAGLIAGMFGVGGGIIQGPLMLQLGVPPDVSDVQGHAMLGRARLPGYTHTACTLHVTRCSCIIKCQLLPCMQPALPSSARGQGMCA